MKVVQYVIKLTRYTTVKGHSYGVNRPFVNKRHLLWDPRNVSMEIRTSDKLWIRSGRGMGDYGVGRSFGRGCGVLYRAGDESRVMSWLWR